MTEYFEVHERDGPARLGELRLDPPRQTPGLVDEVLADAGSLWAADRDVPTGDESRLTVLPHRGFPGGTPETVQETFAVSAPDVDFPSAAVVSSAVVTGAETDAYVLSDVQSVVGHGAALVDALVAVREAIPADTALYCSGVGTPQNVPLLAYAGVDLFDATAARIEGTRGIYLTTHGAYPIESLTELPCVCPACRTDASKSIPESKNPDDFTREECVSHNRYTLESTLATVRERIRAGRLREYVEGQVRHEQWLTAAMRTLDDRWGYVEERTPILRAADLDATTEDAIRRAEIRRYADRVTRRYRNRFDNPLVLLPCSARKPYSESKSHGQFHDAIRWRGHVVTITSPIGVVPQELETTYPAQHYDTVVTGRWSEDEIEFVSEVLRRYLVRNADSYSRVVAHVPDGGYRSVVERAIEAYETGSTIGDDSGPVAADSNSSSIGADEPLDVTYTVTSHPTDADSLSALGETLDGALRYSKREREHNTVRAIADFLIGPGAGDDVFDDIKTTSRYPRLQVRDREGTQLATMVPQYGTLSFTLEGAKRWVEGDAPVKRVEIDDFVPHGSVLAPGVVDASDTIRVGDEVVVEGPSAFGVGRAEMFGREMRESTRGIACEIRHVEER